jgi:hypothetical protein
MLTTLLLGTAQAAQLTVILQSPVALWVDQAVVESPLTGNRVVVEVPAGRHVLEARTSLGRPLANLIVDVQHATEARVQYKDRVFTVTALQGGGAIVGGGWLDPGPERPASAAPPVADAPVAVVSAPVQVQFATLDAAWANVYVDGTVVGEFRNRPQSLTVPVEVGAHRVEIKDFMNTETWVLGVLTVPRGFEGSLKLGFAKGRALEVYNAPGVWVAERIPPAP